MAELKNYLMVRHNVTWADIENTAARKSYYPSKYNTGIDFMDEEWIKYDKE
ncbi:hypothetical protein KY339_02825 [Candidatus Woesearchaeota archaeon]|nr:hypothetical protein [Candidatus Woesearchaeota archaeon]